MKKYRVGLVLSDRETSFYVEVEMWADKAEDVEIASQQLYQNANFIHAEEEE